MVDLSSSGLTCASFGSTFRPALVYSWPTSVLAITWTVSQSDLSGASYLRLAHCLCPKTYSVVPQLRFFSILSPFLILILVAASGP